MFTRFYFEHFSFFLCITICIVLFTLYYRYFFFFYIFVSKETSFFVIFRLTLSSFIAFILISPVRDTQEDTYTKKNALDQILYANRSTTSGFRHLFKFVECFISFLFFFSFSISLIAFPFHCVYILLHITYDDNINLENRKKTRFVQCHILRARLLLLCVSYTHKDPGFYDQNILFI